MKLAPGTRVGSYEVQGSLGAGGMGEVYKAVDRELHRVVALKILPDQFVSDAERVARFEREATTLASMNHPHVAQIYGVATAADGSRALIMEFVEGDDLATRLRRGRLPLDDMLDISRQIAAALEAAHDIGIVHRDLKPANIKVRSDGVVKVLDFGLARTVGIGDPAGGSDDSSGITAQVTEPGVVLGTASYMSPEQAKGLSVDRRSDLWSFGCVVFEMLTGRRAFAGASATETMAAILHTAPDWSVLPVDTPDSIRRLLRRCLVRERSQRLDSAAVARLEIEETSSAAPAAGVPGESRWRRMAWLLVSGVIVAAIASAVALAWRTRSTPRAGELRLDISTPAAADAYSFALSPDGQKIAYVAGGASGPLQLWLRSFDSASATPVPNTEGAVYPFWSPDGHSLAFFANGKLKRVDVSGGAVVTVADAAAGRGGSWGPGDQILFTQSASGAINLVSATGSTVRTVTSLAPGDGGHMSPMWHPDGRRFLFFLNSGQPDKRGAYLASIDGPNRARLLSTDGTAAFRGPREIVFVREGTLYVQAFDDVENVVSGAASPVASPVPSTIGISAFSISRGGPIAYRSGRILGRQLRWFERTGESREAFAPVDAEEGSGVSLSPTSQRAATSRRAGGNSDIWIVNRAGGAVTRLTTHEAQEVFPIWTPDESAIAFRSSRAGTLDIYMTRLDAEGSERLILSASAIGVPQVSPTDISRDGRWLLIYSTPQAPNRDVWVHGLGPSSETRRLTSGTGDETSARFSPDGRWFLYQTNETGRFEIAVRGFPSGERVWQVSTAGGVLGRWSRDGKELFYVAPDGQLMAVRVSATESMFRAGPPAALFTPRFAESAAVNPFNPQYDVAADGRFLINVSIDDLASSPITLILNWNGSQ